MSSDSGNTPVMGKCDIVMKGGIVSGVVYPKAIATLAKHFHFKSIGGTSAGAIAAAAAAAAEYTRQTKQTDRGFKTLDELPGLLGAESGRTTRLFKLFEPQSITKRPFKVMSAVLNDNGGFRRTIRFVFATLFYYWQYSLLGLIPGGILLGFSFCFPQTNVLATTAFVITVVIASLMMIGGAIASSIFFLLLRTRSGLCLNGYGLCSGMPRVDGADSNLALTPWLNEYLDQLAEMPPGKPLTFGDLWHAGVTPGGDEVDGTPADHIIQLQMYTTCLTLGRPYRLPFEPPDNIFYFHRKEFESLFPTSVVEWMVDHQPQRNTGGDFTAGGFYKVPDAPDLPVIVATRLSLSFPVLLSAIPLYTIDGSLKDHSHRTLERCWFSDGGISSNFPVHFFDSPLPRWPTFCINLGEQRIDESLQDLDTPTMATDNKSGQEAHWNRFDMKPPKDKVHDPKQLKPKAYSSQLIGFTSAILWSAKNWSDEVLSAMPGFRDRIATVRLAPNEGLLNLNMDAKTIERLAERGNAAALRFIKRFAPRASQGNSTTVEKVPDNGQLRVKDPTGDSTMTWENHRWIRLRSFLYALLRTLKSVERACEPQENEVRFDDLFREDYQEPSYEIRSKKTRQQMAETLRGLQDLAKAWTEREIRSEESMAPSPHPELRTRPRV